MSRNRLLWHTDYGRALLVAATSLITRGRTPEVDAHLIDAMRDLELAIDDFGQALYDPVSEGWDAQDVLANIAGLHNRYADAVQRLRAEMETY